MKIAEQPKPYQCYAGWEKNSDGTFRRVTGDRETQEAAQRALEEHIKDHDLASEYFVIREHGDFEILSTTKFTLNAVTKPYEQTKS